MALSPATKQTLLAALLATIIPTLGVGAGFYATVKVMEAEVTDLKDQVKELAQLLDAANLQSGIWHVLNANTNDITDMKRQMKHFADISKPDEIRFWGYVKIQVPNNESDIEELKKILNKKKK